MITSCVRVQDCKMRKILSLAGDLLLVGFATILALLLRENFEATPERFSAIQHYLVYTLALSCFALPVFGTGLSVWRFSSMGDYLRILGATLFIVGGAVLLGFSQNRLEGVARSLPILQAMLIVFALVGVRVLMRLRHRTRERPVQLAAGSPSFTGETILVVGMTRLTELYLRSVAEFARDRIQIAGLLGRHERQTGRFVHQLKILGTPEELDSVLRDLEVHGIFVSRIVVTTEFARLSQAAQNMLLAVEKATTIRLDILTESLGLDGSDKLPNSRTATSSQPAEQGLTFQIRDLNTIPIKRRMFWHSKRVLDVVLAAVLLVALAPAIVLVAALVALDVGWPVVFWQQRPGLGGHPFNLYKFRTMASAHDADGHRVSDGDRLSAIGHFLRRTRLDELPQLYNILVGEMSFVGPRPLLPVDQPASYSARLLIRPGLTGWAQIKGGREISAADKAALDVWYVQNASPWRDLQIVAGTVSTVVYGEKVNSVAIRQAWDDLRADGIWQPKPFAAGQDASVGQSA
jgi:lipopolysaccharide/colanic/teichoic acid biosynthesis glycosyltransferase